MVQSGLIADTPNLHNDLNLRIYLHTMLVKLGRRLNVRQVALATAEVYVARFLTRVSIREVNAYMLVTTCLYVACKIEECPQHIRLIASEARNLWPEYVPHDVTRLAEFEFYLIEELDMYLFVHHPYRALLQLKEYFLANAQHFGFTLSDDEVQNSWSLLNDSYVTDIHLLFPPHVVAFAAVYVTIVLKKHHRGEGSNDMQIDDLMNLGTSGGPADEATQKIDKFIRFFSYSHVNADEVAEAMQDLVSLYVFWDRYSENLMRKALHAMLVSG